MRVVSAMLRGLMLLGVSLVGVVGVPVGAQTTGVGATAQIGKLELRIPMEEAGPDGLAAWLVMPKTPGKHPLLLLTHGEYESSLRKEMGPGEMLPEALWFARRGWNVAIVLRRGYGTSGGAPVVDALPHLLASEQAWDYLQGGNSRDLLVAYRYLASRGDVDVSTTVVAGTFTGGSAAMWLAGDPPPGLKAAINFSGGWSSSPDWMLKGNVHVLTDVIEPAFANLGKRSKVPMLWLYPKSGSQFGLKNAVAAHDAFVSAGGKAELVVLPHSGDHDLDLFGGNPAEWGPHVEGFLAGMGLPSTVLIPEDPPPDRKQLEKVLKTSALDAFLVYRRRGTSRAFAYAPSGAWAYSSGRASLKIAEHEALSNCPGQACRVIDSVE